MMMMMMMMRFSFTRLDFVFDEEPLDIVTDSTVRPTYLLICHFRLNKQQYFHTPCRCIFCGKKGQFFLRRDKSRIGHSISINSCNGRCMTGSVLMPYL